MLQQTLGNFIIQSYRKTDLSFFSWLKKKKKKVVARKDIRIYSIFNLLKKATPSSCCMLGCDHSRMFQKHCFSTEALSSSTWGISRPSNARLDITFLQWVLGLSGYLLPMRGRPPRGLKSLQDAQTSAGFLQCQGVLESLHTQEFTVSSYRRKTLSIEILDCSLNSHYKCG